MIFETDKTPLGVATPASYSRLFCERIYNLQKAAEDNVPLYITVPIPQAHKKYKVRSNVRSLLERNIGGKNSR